METDKCVMVLDDALPLGLLANTAAILGITMGMKRPDVVGEAVLDRDGNGHTGIIRVPVPILKGNTEILRKLRRELFSAEYADLTVVDFTELAQRCKTYGEFTEQMAACAEHDLRYLGIAICGDRKKVSRLTGSLPLLK